MCDDQDYVDGTTERNNGSNIAPNIRHIECSPVEDDIQENNVEHTGEPMLKKAQVLFERTLVQTSVSRTKIWTRSTGTNQRLCVKWD